MDNFSLSSTHINHPAWLEATTEKSKAIYEKLGFESVGAGFVRIGAGEVNEMGQTEKGGQGVKLFPMICRSN